MNMPNEDLLVVFQTTSLLLYCKLGDHSLSELGFPGPLIGNEAERGIRARLQVGFDPARSPGNQRSHASFLLKRRRARGCLKEGEDILDALAGSEFHDIELVRLR